jgi:hypothetical protein
MDENAIGRSFTKYLYFVKVSCNIQYETKGSYIVNCYTFVS